jgi:hypothetical protein
MTIVMRDFVSGSMSGAALALSVVHCGSSQRVDRALPARALIQVVFRPRHGAASASRARDIRRLPHVGALPSETARSVG